MITVTCSNCSSKIKVPDNAAGKKGKCPKCGTVVRIPVPESEAPTIMPGEGPSPFSFDAGAAAPPPPSGAPFGNLGEGGPPPADEDAAEPIDAAVGPRGPESTGLSMASLICGILGVLCCGCFPFGIAAIVLGFLGKDKGGRGLAIAGIVLGAIAIVENCGVGITSYFVDFSRMLR